MVDEGTLNLNSGASQDGAKSRTILPLLDLLLLELFKDAKQISEEDVREEVDTFMFAVSMLYVLHIVVREFHAYDTFSTLVMMVQLCVFLRSRSQSFGTKCFSVQTTLFQSD